MKPTSIDAKDVLIVSSDTAFSMALVVTLQSAHFRLTIDSWPLSTLATVPAPDAAIIELRGNETVVQLRELLDRWPATHCLFAVRDMPLKATLARIIRHHGGVILAKGEAPVVLSATLVAMLAGEIDGAP